MGANAKYYDHHVCLHVCLFVCMLAYISKQSSKIYRMHVTCGLKGFWSYGGLKLVVRFPPKIQRR